MKNKKNIMKYTGDQEDLMFAGEYVKGFWFIKFKGKIIKLNNKVTYSTFNKAKAGLKTHIYQQFCQGHYWHKNKGNSFEKEGGFMRYGGHELGRCGEDFKPMSKEMTDWLLGEGIFIITDQT